MNWVADYVGCECGSSVGMVSMSEAVIWDMVGSAYSSAEADG